jgi:hypothetical protein
MAYNMKLETKGRPRRRMTGVTGTLRKTNNYWAVQYLTAKWIKERHISPPTTSHFFV